MSVVPLSPSLCPHSVPTRKALGGPVLPSPLTASQRRWHRCDVVLVLSQRTAAPTSLGGFFPFLELFRCLWEFRNLLSGVGESKAVEQKALKKGEKIIPSFFMLFSSEHPEEECYNLSNPRSSLGCFRGALQAR